MQFTRITSYYYYYIKRNLNTDLVIYSPHLSNPCVLLNLHV